MSTLALIEIQKALYTKLTGDGVLMGMVNAIYDAVPQKSDVPYIVIGDGAQTVQAADGIDVTECRLTLHVWTLAAGRKTALSIMNRIHALMHLGTMSIDGFELVSMRAEEASVRLAEEGTHMNGVLGVLVTVVEA